jgi:hypothetical protein
MKQLFCFRPALFITLVALAPVLPGIAAGGEHPRLFFGAGDVPDLRKKSTTEPWRSMVARLKGDLELDQFGAGPLKDSEPYDLMTAAFRQAQMFVLSGDDAHARRAREIIEPFIDGKVGAVPWASPKLKGLTSDMVGSRVAFCYDFCHGARSWDGEFSAKVSVKLKEMANMIFKHGGAEQNKDPASNWQGIRFATAGLLYLACDEEVADADLKTCHSRVTRYLTENLGDKASMGWNIEGLGYNYFPMGNYVGPFGIAMCRRDPGADFRKLPQVRMTYWSVFAALMKTMGGIHPDFGDDNPAARGEGTYAQAFYYAPPELLPGITWWFDRTYGAAGDGSYDNARGGTLWALLFHPGNAVKPRDPMSIPEWRAAMADPKGNGYAVFRTTYQNSNDLCAMVYAKQRGAKGHQGPDALSFRILGLDAAWAVGGGRYGPKTNGQDVYWRSQNTLYPVDPDEKLSTNKNAGKFPAPPVILDDGGGSALMEIALSNLGVTNHKRLFVADHSKETGAAAAYIVCDSSDNGAFWQFCTIETNAITTDANSFTVTAPNGASLKGTVLHPSTGLTFKTGVRPRGSKFLEIENNRFVHFGNPEGDYLVVMTVVPKGGSHPQVLAKGTWNTGQPDGMVKIGRRVHMIQGDSVSVK